MGILSSKARATAPGSIKNLEEKLRGLINETFRSDPETKYDISSYPIDIIPDKPVKSGSLIIEDYSSNKHYSVPFSTDEEGNYTLGEKEEVNREINYEAVKSSVLAVEKAKDSEAGDSPSECKLYKLSMKLIVDFCEDSTDKLTIYFPECLVSVEYEASGAEEMDAKFELQALSTKRVTLSDDSEVITDIYVKLENDMPEIEAGNPDTSTVTFTVMDNAEPPAVVVGATLKLTNRQSGAELTAAAPTNGSGPCVVNTVPYGWYDIELTSGETVIDTTPSYVSINEGTESKSITANTE